MTITGQEHKPLMVISVPDIRDNQPLKVKPIPDYFLVNAHDYIQVHGMLIDIENTNLCSNFNNTYSLTIWDTWGQQYTIVSDTFDELTLEVINEVSSFSRLKNKRFEKVGGYLRIIGD